MIKMVAELKPKFFEGEEPLWAVSNLLTILIELK